MQIFARLTKVDEATRTVEGIIASEAVDRSGEIFDYERSKPNFVKWSESIAKATDGKNLGNVRVMHGKSVAGITKALNFDDAAKQITVQAEIVDDNEWNKVKKGCYTGFSIGGRYAAKWDDEALGKTRYEADPSEYSLVDLPCNPEAQFTVIKADGTEELCKFEVPSSDEEWLQKVVEGMTNEQREAVLAKIAKRPDVDPKEGKDKYGNVEYADPKNKKYPLDTTKHIKAAWSYIHMPKNAAKYSSEDADAIKSKIASAWKDEIDKDGPPEAEKVLAEQADRLAKNAAAAPMAAAISAIIGHTPALEKGLWAVSQFASLLQELAYMADGIDWEEEAEGDDSTLPAQFRAALKPLAAAFLAMAQEEVCEALHGEMNDEAALALAAAGDLAKAGARHSAKDKAAIEALAKHHAQAKKHLDAMQEHLDSLQSSPAAAPADDDGAEKLAKAADDLQKVVTERDDALAKLAELTKQYADWLHQPAPAKGVITPVEKTVGITEPTKEPDTKPVVKMDGSVDHLATAQNLVKAAHAKPIRL